MLVAAFCHCRLLLIRTSRHAMLLLLRFFAYADVCHAAAAIAATPTRRAHASCLLPLIIILLLLLVAFACRLIC